MTFNSIYFAFYHFPSFSLSPGPTFNQLEKAVQYNYKLCNADRDGTTNERSPYCVINMTREILLQKLFSHSSKLVEIGQIGL